MANWWVGFSSESAASAHICKSACGFSAPANLSADTTEPAATAAFGVFSRVRLCLRGLYSSFCEGDRG